MADHVLIQYAKRKPFLTEPDMPPKTIFDHKKGYWLKDGKKLVTQGLQYGGIASKKCDQETGEDQKGE
jgi:hypothetical protein